MYGLQTDLHARVIPVESAGRNREIRDANRPNCSTGFTLLGIMIAIEIGIRANSRDFGVTVKIHSLTSDKVNGNS